MREIILQGADNVRDLGGLKTKEGFEIRKKILIRSNNLSKITKEDEDILVRQYKVTRIIDLRTDGEIEQAPDVLLPGAEYVRIPLFQESLIGITHERDVDIPAMEESVDKLLPKSVKEGKLVSMETLYGRIMGDAKCKEQISRALHMIIEHDSGAILWHCSEGKDRCGIISALVLQLLDVPGKTIMEDYLKTNETADVKANMVKDRILKATGDVQAAEGIAGMMKVKESYLNSGMDRVRRDYGSIDAFLEKGLGISRQEKKAFKRKMVG